MLNFDPATDVKLKELLSRGRDGEGAVKPQGAGFNALLLELRLKQAEALSGLLGQEEKNRPDPLEGYASILNSLSAPKGLVPSAGLKSGFSMQQGIRQYQAVEAAEPPPPVSADTPVPENKEVPLDTLVLETARKYGVPERWFEKLIRQESGFNPNAVSSKGAMGLGQLMPATARELGLRVAGPADRAEGSVWNPASNLDASARYLRQLYDLYVRKGIGEEESWSFAAGAYNAGMGNIQKVLDKLGPASPLSWDSVAGALPQITGTAARETARYVNALRAYS